MLAPLVLGHNISSSNTSFIEGLDGPAVFPFMYLGAKHMVTGYDHLLFLVGVVFFLYRLTEVGVYVTLFAIGHSSTLLLGVYFDIPANTYLIDAIIGLSVVYKALDNMGAYQRWFGFQPDTKAATLIFGLFHGFGLATKMQDFEMSSDGLLANLIAFNIGVEVGQILALAAILILMGYWRRQSFFFNQAYGANVLLMSSGFMLMGLQITGYFLN